MVENAATPPQLSAFAEAAGGVEKGVQGEPGRLGQAVVRARDDRKSFWMTRITGSPPP